MKRKLLVRNSNPHVMMSGDGQTFPDVSIFTLTKTYQESTCINVLKSCYAKLTRGDIYSPLCTDSPLTYNIHFLCQHKFTMKKILNITVVIVWNCLAVHYILVLHCVQQHYSSVKILMFL